MKLRSWNRRDFSVTQAGYFTVLRPDGWFSTLRKSKKTVPTTAPASMPAPEQKTLDQAGAPETVMPMQIVMPGVNEHHPVRLALILLLAAAIVLAVLWWLTPPVPSGDYQIP